MGDAQDSGLTPRWVLGVAYYWGADYGVTDWLAGSYFDATHEQMVLFNVNDTNLNDIIEAGDAIAVVAVVDMNCR